MVIALDVAVGDVMHELLITEQVIALPFARAVLE